MTRKALAGLTSLSAAAGLILILAPAAAAAACATSSWRTVTGPDGRQQVIQATNWGGGNVCFTASTGDSFTIASQDATRGGKVVAFPDVSEGCSGGHCTAGWTPYQVSQLTDPRLTWSSATAGVSGEFNDAADAWFGQTATWPASGAVPDAELMIWLDYQNVGPPPPDTATINGTTYYVRHHTNAAGTTYIQFRRASTTRAETGMRLAGFYQYAQAKGWLSPSDYLWQFDMGFEIWNGGAGLSGGPMSLSLP